MPGYLRVVSKSAALRDAPTPAAGPSPVPNKATMVPGEKALVKLAEFTILLAITRKRSFLNARRPFVFGAGTEPGTEGDQKGRSNGFGNDKWRTLDGGSTLSMAAA